MTETFNFPDQGISLGVRIALHREGDPSGFDEWRASIASNATGATVELPMLKDARDRAFPPGSEYVQTYMVGRVVPVAPSGTDALKALVNDEMRLSVLIGANKSAHRDFTEAVLKL